MKSRQPRPFIPVSQPNLIGKEREYVLDCLDSTWISSIGKYVSRFEELFASFCEAPYAVSTNNGTSALHLALAALGVGPGDEVIVPTLTFVATANAVRYCGATPVLVDCQRETMNISPEAVESAITERTKGVICVHLYGHPADMDPILGVARAHRLFVLEDAAEAHGALYKGRPVGGIADAGTFSFFGNKIMTTGEGGMVTTSDPKLNSAMRLLRGQGMDPERRYWFTEVGFNYRMTNIQAAIGLAQLEMFETHKRDRANVARLYMSMLEPLGDFIEIPPAAEWATPVYWTYVILLREPRLNRDKVMEELLLAGVETRPVFYPMHVLPPYRDARGRFPSANEIAARGICLPMHGQLTEEHISYICDSLMTICKADAVRNC
jgi:perosamine synthetase